MKFLKKTAHILFDTFNETGLVGRYGGDEFQVFIKGAQKREKIESVMVKLYKSLEEMNLHCSAGVAFVNAKEFSFNEMFSRADDALYWCKKNGRSKYKFHEDFKKEY
ncbi:diguanylate cyclase [Treponema peruense]|uniref:Diguanylate cyclase n=1 Tax=Treponema peruense TaxID=2787628 RepID=A0A7T3RCB7_9SPIR|nr:diguanylate cyclase [Treponema peruense]QQA00472.1 diguanylate cyclase [Treponema peruense]